MFYSSVEKLTFCPIFVPTYQKSGLGGESEPLAPRLRLEFDKILDMLLKCFMMIDL